MNTDSKADPCLLIIAAEPAEAEALCFILQSEGFDARSVRKGSEGLDLLRRNDRVKMVLLDSRLPDMDGLELHRQIQREKPRLPCLILSGEDSQERIDALMNAGAFAYMLKPVESEILINVVRKGVYPEVSERI